MFFYDLPIKFRSVRLVELLLFELRVSYKSFALSPQPTSSRSRQAARNLRMKTLLNGGTRPWEVFSHVSKSPTLHGCAGIDEPSRANCRLV
jgi:hypothetical protein